jgi:adenylate cyclase
MEYELERKYLLKKLPEGFDESVLVQQGYLYVEPFKLRVRRKGARCFMTYKGVGDEERVEWEKEIPDWLYDELLTKKVGRLIVKNRYTLERDGHIYEVDEYLNEWEGTIIAEIEFQNRKELELYKLPAWLGESREVTYNSVYKNKNLATNERS